MAMNRVLQWRAFGRGWWLYDAHRQCPFKSAYRIAVYLQGKHKPIYHPLSDLGDHVVVFNTRHIAMYGDKWRTFTYYHDTGYPSGKSHSSAWRVHELDPTKQVPESIMANITDQMQQVQYKPKRIQDYSMDEIDTFPKFFDWPDDYVKDDYKRFLNYERPEEE